jgi:hypothetical protein
MSDKTPEEIVYALRQYRAALTSMHDRFLARLVEEYMQDHGSLCEEIKKAHESGVSINALHLMIVGLGVVSLEVNRDLLARLEELIKKANEGDEWKHGNDSI